MVLLDDYRRSYEESYGTVVGTIRNQLGLEPTGRPSKSTTSITEKLRRESIRLSQVQDIAGCRLIVTGIADQNRVVASILSLFPDASIVDRRKKPSNSYRAVHVIAEVNGKLIEVQVRTELQQAWAELCEKFSDLEDPSIKYGGGRPNIRRLLDSTSSSVARVEEAEAAMEGMPEQLLATRDLISRTEVIRKRLHTTLQA